MVVKRSVIIALITMIGAIIIAWQPLLATRQADFRGLVPFGGSEEGMYMIRTQHALLHPFSDASNGVWTGADAPSGPQSPGLEEAIGALLFWTGISAPLLVLFLSIFITPLMIPLGFALARKFGANWWLSILSSIFFFWLIAFGKRYFHPGFSMPVVLATLLLFWRWYETPTKWSALFAGLLLGFTTGVYLWAWTFLYAFAALLCIGILIDKSVTNKSAYWKTLPFGILGTLITGGPTVYRLLMIRSHPLFQAVSDRIGLVQSHMPESIIRSLLTVVIFIGAVWIFRHKTTERKRVLPVLAMLAALAVMYNQQIIHGTVMSFSSHYIQYLYVAVILLIVAIIHYRMFRWDAAVIAALCALPLITGISDQGGRLYAFQVPDESAMAYQHLASSFDALGTEKQTVLTDRKSADIIASYTNHDVVFTEYSGFLLVTDEEYEERACLSEVFGEPIDYAGLVVHAEERLKVIRHQETEEQFQESIAKASAVCGAVRANPRPYLRKYHVTKLLWNEKERPDWAIDESLFKMIKKAEGWSLWTLQ